MDAKKSCPVGFRYALSANSEESALQYNRGFYSTLTKRAKEKGSRIIDNIAGLDYMPDSSLGGAYVMACAVKYEIAEEGTLPSGHSGFFGEIGFDLIICDFSDRSVVVSIPCRLVFQEHGEKSDQHLVKLYEEHLPEVFAKIAEEQWNPGLFFKTIGITKTEILQPENMEEVPPNMVGCPQVITGKHHTVSSQIAASRFYDAIGIPVQPYSGGEEALFYGLRENLVNAPDLRSKQLLEQINGSGFVLKKPHYQMSVSGAYFRTQNAGFENSICMYRLIIKNEAGEEIFNQLDQAASDGIPSKNGNNELLWHYQADATTRMFQKFADKIRAENKNGNKKIRPMWNDLIDARSEK